MNDIMSEAIGQHQRETDSEPYYHYRHELAIKALEKRVDDHAKFIDYASPNLAYIESVINRNNERAEFFKKTTYNIAGWGIMGILTCVGGVFITVVWPALMAKIKSYIGGF